MKALILILSTMTLTACGSGGGGAGAASDVATTPAIVSPTPVPAPTPQALTYYSYTNSFGIPGGYTAMTGSCMEYNSNTYCWDDGEKQIWNSNYCSYWQVGGCTVASSTDVMADPVVLSVNRIATLTGAAHSPSQILSGGTPTSVTCTDDGSTLDCGSVQVDLTQVAL